MIPLAITAEIPQEIQSPSRRVNLDGLLGAAVARRDNRQRGDGPLEIPMEVERGIRLWGGGEVRMVEHDKTWLNQRFPVEEALRFGGEKLRRVNLSAGPTKSYHIPQEVGFLDGGQIQWWCMGAAEEIRALLCLVSYVGKKTALGRGRVERWTVEECEPWPGFPCVRDGLPLRPLPLDWPGLVSPSIGRAVLTMPYDEAVRTVECAMPEGDEC